MKIILKQGAPGSLKSALLPDIVKKHIQKSDRFQTGVAMLRVKVLTFTHLNRQQAERKYYQNIQPFMPADVDFMTIDSFIQSLFIDPPLIDWDNKGREMTKDEWLAYLKDPGLVYDIKASSPDYPLYKLLKEGEALLSDKTYTLVVVDESNDLSTRQVFTLLAAMLLGRIETLYFLGDIYQILYPDRVALLKSPYENRAWSAQLHPENLNTDLNKALRTSGRFDVTEEPYAGRSYRLSSDYLDCVRKSSHPIISRLYNGSIALHEVTSERKDARAFFGIKKRIEDIVEWERLATVQLSKNVLGINNKGTLDVIKRIEKRSGQNLIGFLHPAAHKRMMREISPAAVLPNRDLDIKPSDEARRFVRFLLSDTCSRVGAFRRYLRLYDYYLTACDVKEWHPTYTALKKWIDRVQEQSDRFIDESLARYGLVGLNDWHEIMKMHVDPLFYKDIAPDFPFLTAWTHFKAKGQTFAEGTLMIGKPLPDRNQNDFWINFNSCYTALSRSESGALYYENPL